MADAPKTEPESEIDDKEATLEALRVCWKQERTTMFQRAMLMGMAYLIRVHSEKAAKK